MHPTDLTIAAVVKHDGRYLLVEETGCSIRCGEMIGVYLWIHPQTRQQFLRIVYSAEFESCDASLQLDYSIVSRQWLTRADLV